MENKETIQDVYAEAKIGDYLMIYTKVSIIFGQLIGKGEYYPNNNLQNEVKKYYRIVLLNSSAIDIMEDDIEYVEIADFRNNKSAKNKKDLESFKEKYDVELFDEEGSLLNSSEIIHNIIEKNIWKGLSDDEKQSLFEKIRIDAKTVVEMLDAYYSNKAENEKLHAEKLKVLDDAVRFMEEYRNVMEEFAVISPGVSQAIQVILKQIGVQQMLNAISTPSK